MELSKVGVDQIVKETKLKERVIALGFDIATDGSSLDLVSIATDKNALISTAKNLADGISKKSIELRERESQIFDRIFKFPGLQIKNKVDIALAKQASLIGGLKSLQDFAEKVLQDTVKAEQGLNFFSKKTGKYRQDLNFRRLGSIAGDIVVTLKEINREVLSIENAPGSSNLNKIIRSNKSLRNIAKDVIPLDSELRVINSFNYPFVVINDIYGEN